MYYIIGDIHGYFDKLLSLINVIEAELQDEDIVIFLGDYIDRGPESFEVIEYLIEFSKKRHTVFLKGNHEDMLLRYLKGENIRDMYIVNGGAETINSYKKNYGKFSLPEKHREFYENLKLYYEADDFIAVHAGLNPRINSIEEQDPYDLIWIRDAFFRSSNKWSKTVIFGHTPTPLISGERRVIIDNEHNIIAVDSGVIYGGPVSCLRLPDKMIFESYTYK